ncbi:MAG: hypothetical protein KAG37_11240, partial [Flavobacteriales bacterium]|nr:hypothetical protein [Flavobacteriales bacterium]
MQYKYQLEKYTGIKSRFTCPDCERRNSFTRYVDVETNEYIADNVGICNRKIKCGYHKAPKEYLEQNNTPYLNNKISIKKIENVKPMDTIPLGKLEKSITNKSINNFIEFLYSNFDKQSVDKVIELYRIGTHDYWKGATVFWQIDSHNKIRTGKLMLYNSNTGKRVKKPHSHINWYHSIFKKKHNLTEYNLEQCLFGEHIIIDKNCNDIAIVESEKTAIICSIYFPNIVWL